MVWALARTLGNSLPMHSKTKQRIQIQKLTFELREVLNQQLLIQK
jgi:hypothetical protein